MSIPPQLHTRLSISVKLNESSYIPFTMYSRIFLLLACFLVTPVSVAHNYDILKQAPYDASVFTQGLYLEGDFFYISSGLYGKSFVAIEHRTYGRLLTVPLAKHFFAEGLAKVADSVYLLTWKSESLLELDAASLQLKQVRSYHGEGWGLTHTGDTFVMSNGSHRLQFRDSQTFELEREIEVKNNGRKIHLLNELEYAQGAIWANVWYSNKIFKIRPSDGKVLASWDLSNLRKSLKLTNKQAVLNGIAYDKDTDAFWLTGKYWPSRFLVKLNAQDSN